MITAGEKTKQGADEAVTLLQMVIEVKCDLSESVRLRRRADSLTEVLTRHADDLKQLLPNWLTRDDEYGKFVRAVEQLRKSRSTFATITVEQLAKRIGRSRATTDKLLASGQIPGAQRKTPGQSNSPWIIPADAAESFQRAA
jgi:hypothetical protein